MPEPDRFPYSPLPERPRLEWPDGARVALWVRPISSITNTNPP